MSIFEIQGALAPPPDANVHPYPQKAAQKWFS